MRFKFLKRESAIVKRLQLHFRSTALHVLVTASRTFPATSRVDLQRVLEDLFSNSYPATLLGLHLEFQHETLSFPQVAISGNWPVHIGPLQHDEVDIGEAVPARCLKHGLWLAQDKNVPFAALLTAAHRFGQAEGIHLEIAVPHGDAGAQTSHAFLAQVERLLTQSASYRGKVISLEQTRRHSGQAGHIRVHKLRPVARDQVILPDKTLRLLERNVHEFLDRRDALGRLGMSLKKGLLLYGPPGTGKTHSIHYLARLLEDHTTLLITSEQVGLLDEYFLLARFLQPALVVIEDVDLIARAREEMRSACEESTLNKLLNEMDGLREDSRVMFILTTNRPDQLEAALAARPGRIDQAIEFPLPDDDGRRKLIRLYAHGLEVPESVAELIVQKTKRASAAFIKELMRRSAQYHLQTGGTGPLAVTQVEAALDEMFFSGGSLNVKLLGGQVPE